MENWKEIVENVAPIIGTALGGPFAGAATKFLSEKLLGNPDASETVVKQAILTASPEQLSKLKELDGVFSLEMKKLEVDVFRLAYSDKENARDLFKISIWPQITFSAIFVIGYFIVLGLLLESPDVLPTNNQMLVGVFTTVFGVLTAAIPQILNFWFGSSLGSKEKTSGLSKAANSSILKG